jgi:type IV pilus assembly protein PilX
MKISKDIVNLSGPKQDGIALPIVLIFLVIMLVLGVTAIRNVTLGEKMAGNQRNQQLAFQAAEKALRYCENAVQTTPPVGLTWQTPAEAPASNLWEVAANWATSSTVSVALPVVTGDGLNTPPRCMVEDVKGILGLDGVETQVDPTVQAYRITARGTGGTDNAVALLQSYLKFK